MKAILALTLAGAAALAALFTSTAGAQPGSFDHLECYQINDTLAHGAATADLVPQAPPFLAALGCKIKLPAREYCTATSSQNLEPPPASTVGGTDTGEFFCYRIACPRDADVGGAAMQSEDQFGPRTIFVRKPKRLCVPATRATPTPASTPTAPTPTVTPTPPHDAGCTFDGTECQGFCQTANRCLWDPGQSRCVCPAVFDADCDHAFMQCGGELCYGPGQQCVPNPQSTAQLCGCVTAPTATPRPCNNSLFPQCAAGDCGPSSQCFNFGSFCACEPPTPTPPNPGPTP